MAFRLTGLPPAADFPRVTVTSDEEGFLLTFAGAAGERQIEARWRYLEGDPESIELRLLADLQRRGYEVVRP
jgi:hypothetical protein